VTDYDFAMDVMTNAASGEIPGLFPVVTPLAIMPELLGTVRTALDAIITMDTRRDAEDAIEEISQRSMTFVHKPKRISSPSVIPMADEA
jgi:hypothetical protein